MFALRIFVLCFLTTAASAQDFMEVSGPTTVQPGWIGFCERNPYECGAPKEKAPIPVLTAKRLAELQEVNTLVNASVVARTDLEQYGELEYWSYPYSGFGDCEDYALQKRLLLNKKGWPRSALLLTVVFSSSGGHTVLTVKTSGGELVLDNLNSRLLFWRQTGYEFVKRQSEKDPNVWVALRTPAQVVQIRSHGTSGF
jgi:predicted transglutaminase-like cysteine proteinase